MPYVTTTLVNGAGLVVVKGGPHRITGRMRRKSPRRCWAFYAKNGTRCGTCPSAKERASREAPDVRGIGNATQPYPRVHVVENSAATTAPLFDVTISRG